MVSSPDSSDPDTRRLKTSLRRDTIAARAALGDAARQRASDAICGAILTSRPFQAATQIMGFAPMPEEVNILPLLQAALDAGKKVALPRVVADGVIQPFFVNDLARDVAPGYRGIPEPVEGSPPCAAENIGLVVVPAVAVDRSLFRLGYGGGFYDRFLPTASAAEKSAAVFQVQRVDVVPLEEHDVALDGCFTE